MVKTKKFKAAIRSCFLNCSQKYRAFATLHYLYPVKIDKMITGATRLSKVVSENDMSEVTRKSKNVNRFRM